MENDETRIVVVTPERVYAWFERGKFVQKDPNTWSLEAPIDSLASRIEVEKKFGLMPKLSLKITRNGRGELRVKTDNITYPFPYSDRTSIARIQTKLKPNGVFRLVGQRREFDLVDNVHTEIKRSDWKRESAPEGFHIFSNLHGSEHGYARDLARYVSPALVIKRLFRKRLYTALNQKNMPLLTRLNDHELIHEIYFDEDGDLKLRTHTLMSTFDEIVTYKKEIREIENV